MDPKPFAGVVAGVLAGMALSRAFPPPAVEPVSAVAAPAAESTPFACVTDAGTAEAEVAKHAGRVVVFAFWSPGYQEPWLPTLERLRSTYEARGVDLVGVVTSNHDALEAVCRDQRLRWPQLKAEYEQWKTLADSRTVVVVGRDGKVVHRGAINPRTWSISSPRAASSRTACCRGRIPRRSSSATSSSGLRRSAFPTSLRTCLPTSRSFGSSG